MSTIFSKIISGEIPSYKVYEDEFDFAFLDINPMQKGHTLVIPKIEKEYLFDLDEVSYDKLMHRVRYVAMILKAKLKCAKVCMIVEGYAVPHAHVHLIPTNNANDLDKRLVYKATDEELKEMHDLLAS